MRVDHPGRATEPTRDHYGHGSDGPDGARERDEISLPRLRRTTRRRWPQSNADNINAAAEYTTMIRILPASCRISRSGKAFDFQLGLPRSPFG
jgi:hypothetical protein